MNKLQLNGYKAKHYNSSNFVRIFHHKFPFGNMFLNYEECNKSLKKNKFSVIGSIDESFKINNNYHFLLEYPEINARVEWEQELPITSNVTDVHSNVYNKTFREFKGIAYSGNKGYTCFDDTPSYTGTWWYAVGIKNKFKEEYIPGPVVLDSYITVKEVQLWMKIEDISIVKKLPVINILCSQKKSYSTILISALAYAVILSNK